MSAPTPTLVHYHRKARELEIGYADGSRHRLSVEYLRVFSPSAEVRGHGGDTATLQVGKKDVGLADITQAGRQAFQWLGAESFTGDAGQLRYADDQLQGDINGDGLSDLVIGVQNLNPMDGGFLILS